MRPNHQNRVQRYGKLLSKANKIRRSYVIFWGGFALRIMKNDSAGQLELLSDALKGTLPEDGYSFCVYVLVVSIFRSCLS